MSRAPRITIQTSPRVQLSRLSTIMTSKSTRSAGLRVSARDEAAEGRPWEQQRMHAGSEDGEDRNGWMVEDLEWEREGQRGGLQGRVNLEGRLPPRRRRRRRRRRPPPPTTPNPTPRRAAGDQVEDGRTCEAARRTA